MVKKQHKWILEELKDLKKRGLISQPRKRASRGYAKYPIAWSVEGNFKNYGIKENGEELRAFVSYKLSKNKKGIILIDYDKREKVKQNIFNKFLKSSKYIINRKKKTDELGSKLYNFCTNDLSFNNIQKASKKQLWKYYDYFKEIYTEYEFYNSVWFFISDEVTKLIIAKLNKIGCTKFEEIETLMTPRFQSFINRETIDLYEALLVIKMRLGIDKFNELSFDEFKENNLFEFLKDLKKKYFWIPFGHIGPHLYNEEHYFNEIKKIFDSKIDIEKEIENAKLFYAKIKVKQEIIFRKYGFSKELIRYIRDLHLLAQLQDERKELISKTHINWVNNLMKKISKFLNLNVLDACDVEPLAIKRILIDNILNLDSYYKFKNAKRRFDVNDKNEYTFYNDDNAENFLNFIEIDDKDINELKGNGASRGLIKARVKILFSSDEINKVERGDILVTTMTTPDFVPAMRKASGIITDEGGITCHAAIVSREFGLPCIINTKHATEILKDGDLVELDANKGIVKILEK